MNFFSTTLQCLNNITKVSRFYGILLNPFHATGLFLYRLKTSENFQFSVPGGTERDQWHEMGSGNSLQYLDALKRDTEKSLHLIFTLH